MKNVLSILSLAFVFVLSIAASDPMPTEIKVGVNNYNLKYCDNTESSFQATGSASVKLDFNGEIAHERVAFKIDCNQQVYVFSRSRRGSVLNDAIKSTIGSQILNTINNNSLSDGN